MVIDPSNSLNTQNAAANRAKAQAAKADQANSTNNKADKGPAAEGDSVSLSAASLAIASVEAKLGELSDVDSAKVDQIKSAINSGNYQIDADAIARKIQDDDQLVG